MYNALGLCNCIIRTGTAQCSYVHTDPFVARLPSEWGDNNEDLLRIYTFGRDVCVIADDIGEDMKVFDWLNPQADATMWTISDICHVYFTCMCPRTLGEGTLGGEE